MSVAANMAAQAVQLLLLVAVTRQLGERSTGIVALALLINALITVTSTNGLSAYGTRTVATDGSRAASMVIHVGIIRAALALALVLAVGVLGRSWFSRDEAETVLYFAAAAIPQALAPDWLFLGQRDMRTYSVLIFALRGGSFAVAWVVIALTGNTAAGGAATLISNLLVLMVVTVKLRLVIAEGLRQVDALSIWKTVRNAAPLGLGSILAVVLFSLDSLLVRSFYGATTLGVYAAATRPLSGVRSAVGLLTQVLFPRAVQANQQSGAELESFVRRTRLAVVAATAMLSGAVLLSSEDLLEVLYRRELEPAAAAVMRLYALQLPIAALAAIAIQLDVLVRRSDLNYMRAVGATLLVGGPIAVVLVTGAGAIGAAVAALVIQALLLILSSGWSTANPSARTRLETSFGQAPSQARRVVHMIAGSSLPEVMRRLGRRLLPSRTRRRLVDWLATRDHFKMLLGSSRDIDVVRQELGHEHLASWSEPTVDTRGTSERVIEIPWVLSRYAGETTVLDIGTVNAPITYRGYLAARAIPRLVAVDLVATRVRGFSVVCADIRRLPFDSASFELILCVSTLEHVGYDNSTYGIRSVAAPNGDVDALRELRRVLRPTGRLLLTVPFGLREDHGWFQQYDLAAWTRLVSASGMNVTELATYSYTANGWMRNQQKPSSVTATSYQAGGARAATGVLCATLSKSEHQTAKD